MRLVTNAAIVTHVGEEFTTAHKVHDQIDVVNVLWRYACAGDQARMVKIQARTAHSIQMHACDMSCWYTRCAWHWYISGVRRNMHGHRIEMLSVTCVLACMY